MPHLQKFLESVEEVVHNEKGRNKKDKGEDHEVDTKNRSKRKKFDISQVESKKMAADL